MMAPLLILGLAVLLRAARDVMRLLPLLPRDNGDFGVV